MKNKKTNLLISFSVNMILSQVVENIYASTLFLFIATYFATMYIIKTHSK
jgi:hypothetical protein